MSAFSNMKEFAGLGIVLMESPPSSSRPFPSQQQAPDNGSPHPFHVALPWKSDAHDDAAEPPISAWSPDTPSSVASSFDDASGTPDVIVTHPALQLLSPKMHTLTRAGSLEGMSSQDILHQALSFGWMVKSHDGSFEEEDDTPSLSPSSSASSSSESCSSSEMARALARTSMSSLYTVANSAFSAEDLPTPTPPSAKQPQRQIPMIMVSEPTQQSSTPPALFPRHNVQSKRRLTKANLRLLHSPPSGSTAPGSPSSVRKNTATPKPHLVSWFSRLRRRGQPGTPEDLSRADAVFEPRQDEAHSIAQILAML